MAFDTIDDVRMFEVRQSRMEAQRRMTVLDAAERRGPRVYGAVRAAVGLPTYGRGWCE